MENGKGIDGGSKSAVKEIFSDFVATFRDLPIQLRTFLPIDFVFTFAWAVTEAYFVIYAKEVVWVTAAQWGFATTLVMLVTIVLKPLLARASDRHGRMKFILLCMFLWPVAFLMFAGAGGFQAILVARLLLVVSSSIGDPVWEAMFYDYSPREYRGRFAAIASVSWAFIWGAGSVLGGAMYGGGSKQLIFYVSAGLLLVGAFAAILKVKEPEERAD